MGNLGLPEFLVLLLFGAACLLYVLPTIIAAFRQKANVAPIILVNVLLGWTFIGWIVAMVWALSTQAIDAPPRPVARPTPPLLCSQCGKYSPPTAAFCQSCGTALLKVVST